MLYFTIKTDPDTNVKGETQTKYLCINRGFLDDSKQACVYSHEHGTICIYMKFSDPCKWGDEARWCASDAVARFQYASEHMLIKQGLFYKWNEHTEEFFRKRFADALNSIYGRNNIFDEFDTGAIWNAIVSIKNYLGKHENSPVISDKELNRISRFIHGSIVVLDHSIGLHSKLVKACKKSADGYPESIKNVKAFCSHKAFLMLAYLFLLPVKEYILDRVISEETDLIKYLVDCLGGVTIHTYEASFDTLYNTEDDNTTMNQVIYGPAYRVEQAMVNS